MNNTEYNIAAKECARYIFDSEWIQTSYQEYVQNGDDPRDHILYLAAIVLDQTDEFQPDIDEYLKEFQDA